MGSTHLTKYWGEPCYSRRRQYTPHQILGWTLLLEKKAVHTSPNTGVNPVTREEGSTHLTKYWGEPCYSRRRQYTPHQILGWTLLLEKKAVHTSPNTGVNPVTREEGSTHLTKYWGEPCYSRRRQYTPHQILGWTLLLEKKAVHTSPNTGVNPVTREEGSTHLTKYWGEPCYSRRRQYTPHQILGWTLLLEKKAVHTSPNTGVNPVTREEGSTHLTKYWGEPCYSRRRYVVWDMNISLRSTSSWL